jgi:hypothetical protein
MPRNITVTFEDGSTHVYQNAPDALTPEQVHERASKDFGKSVKALDGGRKTEDPSIASSIGQQVGNLAAGAVRGAGSIGATLLWPIDKATDIIKGDRGPNLTGLVTGQQPISRNEERRQAMTNALGSMGADTNSLAFGAGKLGAEIAGTAAVGGILGSGAKALGASPTVVNALASAGMRTGAAPTTLGARAADLAIRSGAGAATGGVSTGLVDPESAGAGALIGGAAPGVIGLAGKAGQAVGRVLRGPEQSAQMAQAVKSAQELGLVIPPTQAKASLGNRLLEGAAGKLTTAQNASAKNSARVKEIAAEAIGLPKDTQLTPEVISNVKKAAGTLYEAVSSAGTITPGQGFNKALDKIVEPHLKAMAGFPNAKPSPVITLVDSLRSDAFDAASAVAKVKELRSMADDAFKPGGQGADIGRAAKSAAKAIEDALDDHLVAIGEPDLLRQFRDARTLYAKTATVEKALDKTSGTVDARKLAAELQKGKPLSGDLKKVAEAAGQFKTAFKTPEQMGSLPQFSPLDLYGGAGIAGVGGALTGNPLAALGLGLPLARAGARNLALSPAVQNRLVQAAPRAAGVNPLALGVRAYPLLAADQ